MKFLLGLVVLAIASPALANYRTIDLTVATFSNSDSGSAAKQSCETSLNNLRFSLDYFTDDGYSLTFAGSCVSITYWVYELRSQVKTNLPVGDYSPRNLCALNPDFLRRVFSIVSNNSFQVFFASIPNTCEANWTAGSVRFRIR